MCGGGVCVLGACASTQSPTRQALHRGTSSTRVGWDDMGSAKKNREEKPNKKEKPPPDESSDESSDEEEEEEEIEPEHVRRKRERGRNAFLNLLRRFMTLIPLAVVLSRQPFMVKPRAPGVNLSLIHI